MNFIRKCLTAAILVLIMMPAIYSIYFQVKQQLIHWKMWSLAEEEANDVVVIHASKLYWMEKDREIFVNGLMFDVESIEKVGDSLRITGEFDYEESGLLEKLESVTEKEKKEGRQANAILLLVQVMDDSMSGFQTTYIDFSCPSHKIFPRISALPIVYLNTIYPPPKV
jgi:hypothetical protein